MATQLIETPLPELAGDAFALRASADIAGLCRAGDYVTLEPNYRLLEPAYRFGDLCPGDHVLIAYTGREIFARVVRRGPGPKLTLAALDTGREWSVNRSEISTLSVARYVVRNKSSATAATR